MSRTSEGSDEAGFQSDVAATLEQVDILYVEDDPAFADLGITCLEDEDDRFSITTARDAEAGLQRLTDDIDCIISDYNMPGMDGIEFLERVREKYPGLPFILFTGKGSEAVASDAISAGVTDYLQKEGGTDQFTVLSNRITNVVEKDRAQEKLTQQTRQIETVLSHSPIISFALDSDGVFTLSEGKPLSKLGLRPGEVVGESVYDVFADNPAIIAAVESALNGEQTTVTHEIANGTYQTTYNPVLDDEGSVSAVTGVAVDITERRQRQRRFEALVEESNDIISVLDADGVFQYNSPSLERILGYDPEEILGDTAWEYIHPEDRDAVMDTFEEWVTVPGTTAPVEYRARHADGSWRWMEARGTSQHDNPAVEGHVVNSRDITNRKEREQQVKREQQRYATLFETLPVPVLHARAKDGEPVVKTVNPAFEETFGVDAETIIGEPLHEYILPEDQAEPAKRLNHQIMDKTEVQTEVQRETTDGVRTFRLNCRVRQTDADQLEGYAVYTDITDREEYERELEVERQRFRNLFEQFAQPTVEVEYEDGKPIVNCVNQAFEDTFGYEATDIAGESLDAYIVPEDRQDESADINETVQETGALDSREVTRQTASGAREFLLQNAVFDNGSKAFAVYTDITERKQRERELEMLRDAVENAHTPLVLTDPTQEDNPMVYVNKAFEDVTGYAESEAVGRNCRFLQGEKTDPEKVARLREAIDAEEPVTVELRNYRKDGTAFWNRISITPIYDSDGNLLRYFGSQEDITEYKESERTLQQENERLDAFASVVSHDLRNPIQIADGHLELAREECDSTHLETAGEALDRCQTLIDDLLAVARTGVRTEQTEAVELREALTTCWETVQTEEATLTITTDQAVTADRTRFRQLLENLLRNAVEHGGEDTHVRVEELDEESGFAVADDGPGIPAERRDEVFENGYSTDDNGTGFGLAIVQEIVQNHDWSIRITESAEGGARFEITDVEIAAE